MTHYGLNDCTNLSNIIDIMNSLTPLLFVAYTAPLKPLVNADIGRERKRLVVGYVVSNISKAKSIEQEH